MDEARRLLSREGYCVTTVRAQDIRSREQARKFWPFVTPNEPRKILTWVSPSIVDGKRRRRAHFRLLPHKTYDLKANFDDEESKRNQASLESPEHRQAKAMISGELRRRSTAGLALPWSFKDPEASDFPLKGNLLLGTESVVEEHILRTPFGSEFRLDVAVLGSPVKKEPLVLGGVEIEWGHQFDGRKALLSKSLAFVLVSIDISEMTLEDITPQWAEKVLTATTRSHPQGRRQTFIEIHDLLYPLYAQVPDFIDSERRHQFLVFADDEVLRRLRSWLVQLAYTLGYRQGEVAVALVRATNDQSRKMLEHAGQVAGQDWSSFNDHQCLRLTCPRSQGPADLRAHRFHITLARLLLLRVEALVGYQYRNGVINDDTNDNIWVTKVWTPGQTAAECHRVLPKRLAEPVRRVIAAITELTG